MNGRALCVNKRSVSHIKRKKQNPIAPLTFLKRSSITDRRNRKGRLDLPAKARRTA